MENVTMEGSPKTPTVNFDNGGVLEIAGRSIPENSIEFYKPLIDWIDEYGRSPQAETNHSAPPCEASTGEARTSAWWGSHTKTYTTRGWLFSQSAEGP